MKKISLKIDLFFDKHLTDKIVQNNEYQNLRSSTFDTRRKKFYDYGAPRDLLMRRASKHFTAHKYLVVYTRGLEAQYLSWVDDAPFV